MKPTQEQIQTLVQQWHEVEHEIGESILDGRFDLHPLTFMTWCYGRGYLTSENYNLWAADYIADKLEAIDSNYFVYSDDPEDVPYALVIDEEMASEEFYDKALSIVAEFILSIDIYQKQWKEFVQKVENDEPID